MTETGSAPGRCSESEGLCDAPLGAHHDCNHDRNHDHDQNPGTCGTPFGAVVFFVTYTIIGSFVMLNVFIAVILDAFDEDRAADAMRFNQANIDDFVEVWQKFDPEGNHLMPTKAR